MAIRQREVKNIKSPYGGRTGRPGTVFDVSLKYTLDGEKKTYSRGGFLSYEEAKAHETEIKEHFHNPDYLEMLHQRSILTVGHLATQWLENCKRKGLTDNTCRNYQSNIKAHILPHIGDVRLLDLNTNMVDDMLERLQEDGRLDSTVQQVRTTLQSILRYGVAQEMISKNVAQYSHVQLVRTPSRKMSYSCQELRRMLKIASEYNLEMVILLTAGYGLRIGEALGLRWCDVDFSKSVIHVTGQLPNLPMNQKEVHTMIPVKTDAGKRDLPLTNQTYNRLYLSYSASDWWSLDDESEYFSNDLVVHQMDGSPEHRKRVLERFHTMCFKENFSTGRIHDFRHSAASNMMQLSGDLYTISKILGHSISGLSTTLGSKVAIQTITDQYIGSSVDRSREVLTQYHQELFQM